MPYYLQVWGKKRKLMNIKKLPISDLKPAEYNPRTITEEALNGLGASFDAFGLVQPIVINKDRTVIGGHQRLKILESRGVTEVECVIVDLDKHEEQKLNVVLNSHAISGDYDMAKLSLILDDLKLDDNYLELRLDQLEPLNLGIEEPVEEDDFDPTPRPEAISKEGDLYEMNGHRLLCGDSTNLDHLDKLMDGEVAEMTFSDPPYLMGFEGNVHADGSKSFNSKHGSIMNDKMSREDGDQFISDIFTSIQTYVSGAFYICFYRLGLDYIYRALDSMKMECKALIIWDKGNHTLSNSDYMSKYEPIVYGWVEEHNFCGDRSNFDIWEIPRTAKNDLHPTMKPLELCGHAIQNSSKKGDIVLDLFLGSGSTLIAAQKTGRRCYGQELDPHYCDVIVRRWLKYMIDNEEKFTLKKNGKEVKPDMFDSPEERVEESEMSEIEAV